jgi:endonuclease/exonuclease/phosphatase (EEP) superfamily protein YafD
MIILKPLRPLILLAALAVGVPLAAGFFNALHPALDSFAHFRAHLAVLLGIAALALLAVGLWAFGATALVAAALTLATTSGSVPAIGMRYGALHPADPERPVYRLLQFNLRYNNPEPAQVLSLIGRVQPDVLTLDEVTAAWREKLRLIKATYRYSLFCPYPNGLFGVAILSRRPFVEGSEPFCDGRGALGIAAVNFGGQTVDIAALHLGWPWPFPQYWEVGGLWPSFGRLGPTAILAGDLNATPWSRTPARVAEAGGLTLMPSPGPTWLSRHLPKALFFAGLPIDNVFAKGDVEMHSIRTLEPTGSDHLPVLVEFSLRSSPADPGTDVAALPGADSG